MGVGTTFKRMWVDECEERRVMTQEVAMGVDDPRNSRRGPGGADVPVVEDQAAVVECPVM